LFSFTYFPPKDSFIVIKSYAENASPEMSLWELYKDNSGYHWRAITPSQAPPPRRNPFVIPINGKIVLFGGFETRNWESDEQEQNPNLSCSGAKCFYLDLWELNYADSSGFQWTQIGNQHSYGAFEIPYHRSASIIPMSPNRVLFINDNGSMTDYRELKYSSERGYEFLAKNSNQGDNIRIALSSSQILFYKTTGQKNSYWTANLDSNNPTCERQTFETEVFYASTPVLDVQRNKILIFGGSDSNALWEGDLNSGFQKVIPEKILWNLSQPSLTADPQTGDLILYGGQKNNNTYENALRVFRQDQKKWIKLAPNTQAQIPPGLQNAFLFFNPHNNEHILFGGLKGTNTSHSDIWKLSYNSQTQTYSWEKLNPSFIAYADALAYSSEKKTWIKDNGGHYQGQRTIFEFSYDSTSQSYNTGGGKRLLENEVMDGRSVQYPDPLTELERAKIIYFEPSHSYLYFNPNTPSRLFELKEKISNGTPSYYATEKNISTFPEQRSFYASQFLYNPKRKTAFLWGGQVLDPTEGRYIAKDDLWELAYNQQTQEFSWSNIPIQNIPSIIDDGESPIVFNTHSKSFFFVKNTWLGNDVSDLWEIKSQPATYAHKTMKINLKGTLPSLSNLNLEVKAQGKGGTLSEEKYGFSIRVYNFKENAWEKLGQVEEAGEQIFKMNDLKNLSDIVNTDMELYIQISSINHSSALFSSEIEVKDIVLNLSGD
ncbi:MAG: hypothetical protein HYY62_02560, partial [Deltaproteobacteria bacterium]|nr:hypothetical protein [Deltaproteobacteria bacterium]